MTKADIYALYIEVEHRFFEVFDEIISEENISLFKEEIFKEKIRITELDLKSVLFEIEFYENKRKSKNKIFLLKVIFFCILSIICFLLNSFLGIGVTFFLGKKIKEMYEEAKFECEGANLKKVKWHINNSIESLTDCKKHIDTKVQVRELRLEQERIKNSGGLDIDAANIALGQYLITEEIPEMSDETRWTLIKMLREDLKCEDWNLDKLLVIALEATPIGVITKGESRCRKKKGVVYE